MERLIKKAENFTYAHKIKKLNQKFKEEYKSDHANVTE